MFYSDDILDQVCSANDIVDVIGQDVPLKRSGSSYVGLCPFHNEKTPSFSVSRQKQMYYCFGCHRGGNVITYIEEYNNMGFLEAVKYLADRAGIRLPEQEVSEEEKRARNERAQLLEVNRLAGTYYYYLLRTPAGKNGLDYLTKRGLSEETMKAFALGYAPKTPSDGLYRYLKSKGISDDLLRRSGLMNLDEKRAVMYDKFWNRVMFPILDTSNRIIGFGGRVMGDAKPKYLNSPETRLFDKSRNLYALNLARKTREDYLVLCEGYMDVISMHQAGFTNTVASLGTALTPGHCALLSRYTKKVVLSYDSDQAGVSAAMRAIPMLRRAGITPKILRLDPYKDPDELISSAGRDEMAARLKKAQNALLFEIEITRRDYDLNDPDSKTRFYEQAAERIAALETEMERQNYIDAVCREYMVDRKQFQELVTRRLVAGPAPRGRGELPAGRARQTEDPATGMEYDPAALYGYDDSGYYEDEETGEMFQAPPSASRKNRSATIKEQGEDTSRKLLLHYICRYPGIFQTVKQYVQPQDFGGGLTGRTAEIIYDQMEKTGKVEESWVLSHFTEPQDQSQVVGIFHTLDQASSGKEREKAVRETMIKVFTAADTGNVSDFNQVIQRRKQEAELRSLQILL